MANAPMVDAIIDTIEREGAALGTYNTFNIAIDALESVIAYLISGAPESHRQRILDTVLETLPKSVDHQIASGDTASVQVARKQ